MKNIWVIFRWRDTFDFKIMGFATSEKEANAKIQTFPEWDEFGFDFTYEAIKVNKL